MRKNIPNVAVFVSLAVSLGFGWWYVDKTFFPKPEPKPEEPVNPAQELVGSLVGSASLAAAPVDKFPPLKPPLPVTASEVRQTVLGGLYAAARTVQPVTVVKPVAPSEAPRLIALGGEGFYKKVLLSTRGGAIQQVTLASFEEANRIGREVKRADGSPQPLRLIPGIVRPLDRKDIRNEAPFPDLAPGTVPADVVPGLAEPSYAMLHYPAIEDPKRDADAARRMNDDHPSPELAERTWTEIPQPQSADGPAVVVFETTLDAPYFLKIRKTYSLAPKEYHVGLKIDIVPLEGRVRGKGKFRYQIVGPRGLPIEGEWYTPTYRTALVGSKTSSGGAKRTYDDAKTIQEKHGSDKITRGDNQFTYAAVVTQYFASAIAVDDAVTGPAQYPWDYVRATREPHRKGGVQTKEEIEQDLKLEEEQPFLSDITVRVVSVLIDPTADETISHQYMIYNGPVKVRLLSQLTGDREVSDELVSRYLDKLTLKTMTDYHSPNFFGRFANAIYWTDVVVMFTNVMHSVLGWLHTNTGLPWGVCIIMLTVMVRMALFLPSRRQQAVMARMQEKMAKVKPEIDKLTEKYKNDPQTLQQEKTKLMLKAGVNPMSTMSGCLLLFAQMPIFMGLYYCLQESVFFRLEPFLFNWIPNLSAPDMTVWWSESIPWISAPNSIGGTVYLGPFLNILPLLTVALIYTQQRLTMPPPTDEQQEMQRRMMKFMILFMAVFFYKSPSGLCIYFICSTSWALAERKLIPKPKPKVEALPAAGGPDPGTNGTPDAPGGGGFLSRLRDKIEKMQESAEGQRQIRNDGTPPKPSGGPPQSKKDKKKRKKK